MPSRERVQQFVSLVERGDYVKAIEDFYHPGASPQEKRPAAARGAPDRARARAQGVTGLESMRTRRVEIFLVDGDRVAINWVFEMIGPDGVLRVMDELALQTWDGDRIATSPFTTILPRSDRRAPEAPHYRGQDFGPLRTAQTPDHRRDIHY